jgi:hypothetical protein
VHNVSDVRRIEVHTGEPLVPGPIHHMKPIYLPWKESSNNSDNETHVFPSIKNHFVKIIQDLKNRYLTDTLIVYGNTSK